MKEVTDMLDFIKIKNFCEMHCQENKRSHRLGEGKYLQQTHVIKNYDPKYTKNF